MFERSNVLKTCMFITLMVVSTFGPALYENYANNVEVTSYPTEVATIIDYHIERSSSESDSGSSSTTYYLDYTIRYNYSDAEHVKKIDDPWSTSFGTNGEARSRGEQKIGTHITIYVNPDLPNEVLVTWNIDKTESMRSLVVNTMLFLLVLTLVTILYRKELIAFFSFLSADRLIDPDTEQIKPYNKRYYAIVASILVVVSSNIHSIFRSTGHSEIYDYAFIAAWILCGVGSVLGFIKVSPSNDIEEKSMEAMTYMSLFFSVLFLTIFDVDITGDTGSYDSFFGTVLLMGPAALITVWILYARKEIEAHLLRLGDRGRLGSVLMSLTLFSGTFLVINFAIRTLVTIALLPVLLLLVLDPTIDPSMIIDLKLVLFTVVAVLQYIAISLKKFQL